MKQSEIQNADNCAYLAEGARDEPTRQQYKRMEAAWRSLADEQDWLDGKPSPLRKGEGYPYELSMFTLPSDSPLYPIVHDNDDKLVRW